MSHKGDVSIALHNKKSEIGNINDNIIPWLMGMVVELEVGWWNWWKEEKKEVDLMLSLVKN